MRFFAKLCLSLLAAALLVGLARFVAARPPSGASLPIRTMGYMIVLALALPPLAIGVLPWLAVPNAAPPGRAFPVSLPKLVLVTIGYVLMISTVLAIAVPAMTLMAGIEDTIDNRDWTMVIVGILTLPGLFLLIPVCFFLLYHQVIRRWRWRHWPLLVIGDDGLHVPGRPPITWEKLKGTKVEIRQGNASQLVITGPGTTPMWLFGPQPTVVLAISLSTRIGPANAFTDAIPSHPRYPGHKPERRG
jgi:hypothetical protein